MADNRIRAGTNQDDGRMSRESESREITEDRTKQDRANWIKILEGNLNEALPDLPPIPGWHICWLSTTNNYDTIPKRMRLGYVPVKPEDLKSVDGDDFQSLVLKGGSFGGMVGWNEMLAYKIPMDRYQAIMAFLHHEKPLEDESMITAELEGLTDASGRTLARDVGEGTEGLSKNRNIPAPIFRG